ncbi:MAG: Eco57I restriction-modification methylase domain-containing protein [Dysgonomonas sp.]
MSRQLLDRLIEDFSIGNLITFFRNKFSGFQGDREDYSHYLNQNQSEKYTDIYKIGETTLNGHEHIIAITALTNDPLTERSGKKTQYDIARTILKSESADLAFFVFHDQEGNFRFSIIKVDRDNNQTEYTTHRRYTYYVSKDQTNRTFRDQIGDTFFDSIADIVKAFSVEKLNKEFYDELSNWYFWATKIVVFPDDEGKRDDIRNATSVIRLITRLIFVWFLKQKRLIPSELFEKDIIDQILNYSDKTGSTYYKAILQNLFFATLNTEMKEGNRKFINRQAGVQSFYRYERFFSNKDRFLQLTKDIPFLNGGLFENLDKNVGEENVTRIDCFSDRRDNEEKLAVPDYLFFGETSGINLNDAYGDKKHASENINGLIDILKRYNFTVEENNPLETEVALDPELLGKVFENLLASYNPETRTTARKQSGSFYTPREIVDYMCEESLFAYLKEATKDNIDEEKLRILIAYNDKTPDFTDDEKLLLIDSIDKCRILDPACGSGAFPMGALQKMVFILQKLDPHNEQWRKRQEERARRENEELIENLEKDRNLISQIESLPELKKQALNELDLRLKQIDKAFALSTNELDYARKLFLIENCIFGVDIQPIAIQISKLRFFISLLVEQKVDDNQENKGVIPMPNMETKFVAANTLIALSKDNLIKPPAVYPLEQELKEARHRHFSARTPETKKKYREEDKKLRIQISELLIDAGFPPASAQQIAGWNPYDQNTSAKWFDPEWMFGFDNGFDIVIGNPPYLRIQGIKESNIEFAKYLVGNYKSATGSFDLYAIFTEKAISLTKKDGITNLIMPVKWTNASFGKGLREFVLKEKAAYKIISFVAYQVFNASTYTGLQWFKRGSKNLMYKELDKDLPSNRELESYLKELKHESFTSINTGKLSKEAWTLASDKIASILSLLEKHPRRLSDIFSSIFQGLATSKDDVYFLYRCEDYGDEIKGYSYELDCDIQIEKALVKPLLKGDDIHKYDTIYTDKYVVFPYKLENGKAALYSEQELKTLFPQGYNYLKECESILRNRERGRLLNDEFWYKYIYPKNLTLFESEKLVAPEISLGGNFSHDKDGKYYSTTKIYGYIKNNNIQESYKFLLSILNSKVLWYYLTNTGYVLRGGYFTFKTNYLTSFPIPHIDNLLITQPFEILVDYLTYLKNPESEKVNPYVENKDLFPVFEDSLNMMVYELYFEEHMKERGIDVLQFAEFTPIDGLGNQEAADIISKTYNWLQEKENPIRNRIILADIRSTDIIRIINSSI